MSDFVQTMKDWRRMCMAMEKLRPDDSCCGCPLEGYGCPAIYEEDSSHVDYADVERNVTAWAADHPVVYPTWGEWFVEHGDLVDGWQNATNAAWMANTALSIFMKFIPADIAEKLGLQPKEGV